MAFLLFFALAIVATFNPYTTDSSSGLEPPPTAAWYTLSDTIDPAYGGNFHAGSAFQLDFLTLFTTFLALRFVFTLPVPLVTNFLSGVVAAATWNSNENDKKIRGQAYIRISSPLSRAFLDPILGASYTIRDVMIANVWVSTPLNSIFGCLKAGWVITIHPLQVIITEVLNEIDSSSLRNCLAPHVKLNIGISATRVVSFVIISIFIRLSRKQITDSGRRLRWFLLIGTTIFRLTWYTISRSIGGTPLSRNVILAALTMLVRFGANLDSIENEVAAFESTSTTPEPKPGKKNGGPTPTQPTPFEMNTEMGRHIRELSAKIDQLEASMEALQCRAEEAEAARKDMASQVRRAETNAKAAAVEKASMNAKLMDLEQIKAGVEEWWKEARHANGFRASRLRLAIEAEKETRCESDETEVSVLRKRVESLENENLNLKMTLQEIDTGFRTEETSKGGDATGNGLEEGSVTLQTETNLQVKAERVWSTTPRVLVTPPSPTRPEVGTSLVETKAHLSGLEVVTQGSVPELRESHREHDLDDMVVPSAQLESSPPLASGGGSSKEQGHTRQPAHWTLGLNGITKHPFTLNSRDYSHWAKRNGESIFSLNALPSVQVHDEQEVD